MAKILRKALVITLTALALGLLITSCSSSSPTTAIIGEPVPDFTLTDLNGNSVSLTDFAGKPMLINFWNTGCPPCRNEMPYLQEVYDENKGTTELALLTINIGQSADTVNDFLEDNHLSLPVLLDADAAVAQRYGMPGIPTTFFIDQDGILQVKVIGAFPTKAAIYSRLNEIVP